MHFFLLSSTLFTGHQWRLKNETIARVICTHRNSGVTAMMFPRVQIITEHKAGSFEQGWQGATRVCSLAFLWPNLYSPP